MTQKEKCAIDGCARRVAYRLRERGYMVPLCAPHWQQRMKSWLRARKRRDRAANTKPRISNPRLSV